MLQEAGKKMERSREQPVDKTRLNQQTSTPKRSQHKAWVRRATLAVLPEQHSVKPRIRKEKMFIFAFSRKFACEKMRNYDIFAKIFANIFAKVMKS